MARKNQIPSYVMFDEVDASSDQDTLSRPTHVGSQDASSLQVVWTGLPVGTFEVLASNDKRPPAHWTSLDFGSPIEIDSLVEPKKSHLIDIGLSFVWLAVRYTATSGAGTLSVTLNSKTVGA